MITEALTYEEAENPSPVDAVYKDDGEGEYEEVPKVLRRLGAVYKLQGEYWKFGSVYEFQDEFRKLGAVK